MQARVGKGYVLQGDPNCGTSRRVMQTSLVCMASSVHRRKRWPAAVRMLGTFAEISPAQRLIGSAAEHC